MNAAAMPAVATPAPASRPPMNVMNGLVRDALAAALGCLHLLADAGCTVISIDISQRRPVIELDAPPPLRFIRGALRRRHSVDGWCVTTRVAVVRGCLVQWTDRTDRGMTR